MINLYPLELLYRDLEIALSASEGEVTPEIETMFEAIQAERDSKLSALTSLIKNSEAEAEIYKNEATRLKSLQSGTETRIERLESLVKRLLPYDEKWSKGPHKLSYRPSVAVQLDPMATGILPEEYIRTRTIREPDKTKIKAAIEGGIEVPTAVLETRYNLQVK